MIKKGKNRGAVVAALLVVMLVPACKKEQNPSPPAPQPAAKAKPPVQKQQSSAQTAAGAPASLDFTLKKDPFKPFIEPVTPAGKAKVATARRGNLLPIQSYEVSQFTVSGIIVGLRENTALIVDPAGKGYVVKPGMLIGNNDGRISRITASSVEVVENLRDSKGHNRKRTIELRLKKK